MLIDNSKFILDNQNVNRIEILESLKGWNFRKFKRMKFVCFYASNDATYVFELLSDPIMINKNRNLSTKFDYFCQKSLWNDIIGFMWLLISK